MFATNIPIDGLDKADEIFCWSRMPGFLEYLLAMISPLP